jgi:acetyl esterase
MKYIEKDLPLSAFEQGEAEKILSQKPMPKMPLFLIRRYLLKRLNVFRANMENPLQPPYKCGREIEKREIRLGEGAEAFSLYTYSAENGEANKPLFYFIHGGSFIGGSHSVNENLMRLLADRGDMLAASADYTPAPEARYPVALNQCMKGLKFLLGSADYNIDDSKVCVAGDSAGGNLAAALVLKARDEGRPAVAKQALIYPVMDMSYMNTGSYR